VRRCRLGADDAVRVRACGVRQSPSRRPRKSTQLFGKLYSPNNVSGCEDGEEAAGPPFVVARFMR